MAHDKNQTPVGWYEDREGRVRYEPDIALRRRLCLQNLDATATTVSVAYCAHKKLSEMVAMIGYVEVEPCPPELKREYTR